MDPENLENLNSIKVFFNGNPGFQTTGLNLTFQELSEHLSLSNFQEFLIEYNELTRKKKVRAIFNIQKVVFSKNISVKIKQYYILLYSKTEDNKLKRSGLLIADNLDSGFKIIGFWPILINEKIQNLKKNPNLVLNEIIKNSEFYQDILLIT